MTNPQIWRRESPENDFSYGVFATDSTGNGIVTFNTSSAAPTGFIGIRYAQYTTNSNLLRNGLSSVPYQRWGDYAGMATDPNGVDLWIAHLFARADMTWGLQIASTTVLPNRVLIPTISR